MDVQLKNSGFEASKMTKSLSVDSGFEAEPQTSRACPQIEVLPYTLG
jgi:hypothetical protein